jgi:DNA-nicking Smr family endonuclease
MECQYIEHESRQMKKRDKLKRNKDDDFLWQEVAKTVNPMPQDSIVAPKPKVKKSSSAAMTSGKTSPDLNTSRKYDFNPSSLPLGHISKPLSYRDLKPADLAAEKVSGISRMDAKRIRSGQINPTARLDLHGMTMDNARLALRRFIAEKQMEKHQHILVITGKGMAGKGVIRQALPNWLDEAPLSEQVVAYHTAKPKDGGTGAWYIKLRQKS